MCPGLDPEALESELVHFGGRYNDRHSVRNGDGNLRGDGEMMSQTSNHECDQLKDAGGHCA
jgi:hypothetical protein